MADVVVARPPVPRQIAGYRGQDAPRGERQEATVRDLVDAVAPRVVYLELHAAAHPFPGRQLESVVVTVGAGVQLGHRAKARIGRRSERKRGETAGANGLVTVDLRGVRLVYGASAHVLRADIGVSPN